MAKKYQVDCEPIISHAYVYDNNPATGYAVGYIYNIKLELKAGKNTLYLGHYEEYGKGGRMNLDGFYIQKWEESAEVTHYGCARNHHDCACDHRKARRHHRKAHRNPEDGGYERGCSGCGCRNADCRCRHEAPRKVT